MTLKKKFINVRSKTEQICLILDHDEFSMQPRVEVSPAKWHLAHTTWFFEKVILEKYLPEYKVYNKDYNFLFNSYYKKLGKHLNQSDRGDIKVSIDEIISYRKYVDANIIRFFERKIETVFENLLIVGLNHEQQHQELLHMDIKAVYHSLNKSYPLEIKERISSQKSWLDIPEGIIECGHDSESFCYDNEKPRIKHYQYSASINHHLVTNSEYFEFISSGGYDDAKYWLSKGWDWLQENNIKTPLYWDETLKPNAPISHVSYFEADAYANWAQCRLPTEFEHEYFDQINNSQSSLWSWTSSQYSPYQGFKKFDDELSEYNGKFMCNQFVLRGGCVATPDDHWRTSYRNFYEPHQRWMYSGIRLAKDII